MYKLSNTLQVKHLLNVTTSDNQKQLKIFNNLRGIQKQNLVNKSTTSDLYEIRTYMFYVITY